MRRRHSPPLGESISRGLGHFGFFAACIYSAYGQLPDSLLFAADPLQLTVWMVFMATGLVAAIAAWGGFYLIEYALIPFLVGATLIYFVSMANVVITGTNPGSGLAMILTFVLASYLTARWVSLNQLIDGPFKAMFRRGRHQREHRKDIDR